MSQAAGQSVDEEARVIFNSESLLRRLMGDRPLTGIVIKGFLEGAPSQLNNLRVRLAEADASGMRLQAHSLKGIGGHGRSGRPAALALAMERNGRAGQLDQYGELLPYPVEEFERFKSTLERDGWA
jgi:HPt (histidine-containing phosphotransfer) domain-containing protein